MKPNIIVSTAVRNFIQQTQKSNDTLRRLLMQHRQEADRTRLPTPEGALDVRLSFHRIWGNGQVQNAVLVESLAHCKYLLYTEAEFKLIVRDSLAVRE